MNDRTGAALSTEELAQEGAELLPDREEMSVVQGAQPVPVFHTGPVEAPTPDPVTPVQTPVSE
jgi:hypothetical protein